MSIDITPTLNCDNIQGDILAGLVKKVESFVFFDITNPTEFRHRLKSVIPLITTTTQVKCDLDAIAAYKAKGDKGLLKIVGTNIAFSQHGLTALGINDNLGDPVFSAGQLQDASDPNGLADPGIVISSTKTDPAWGAEFKQTIHGVLLVTGDCLHTLHERLQQLDSLLLGSIKVLFRVDGAVRPGAEDGHEHFGFQDGLSQPPIIGFRKPNTGEDPTPPGVILIGEQSDPIPNRPTWAKDGSILAFRKLRQFVPEFNDFLALNPIQDKGLSPAQGSELLGARLVGRWKSGAPLDLDPEHDNPAHAADPNQVNNFNYSDDDNQVKCPFTAHLRKMNPRATKSPPGLDAVRTKRIIRQGIPYGPEVHENEKDAALTLYDRGLLFACYQSALSAASPTGVIPFGFHFLQRFWADNINFPRPQVGFDPIIGQQVNQPRTVTGTDPQNVSTSIALPKQAFVVPLGGEYFLSPSISALKTTFSA